MALKGTNKLFRDGCVFLGFVFKMLSIKILFELYSLKEIGSR